MGRDWGRDQPAGQGPLTFWEMWPVKSPRAKGILRASGNRESVLSEGQALLKYIRSLAGQEEGQGQNSGQKYLAWTVWGCGHGGKE